MFRSRFQDIIQKVARGEIPFHLQQMVEYKLELFLKSINDKEILLPPSASGLCNGFAFMSFRAEILDQEDKNVTRFDNLMMMGEDEIEKIGKLYKKYNEARAKLIEVKGEEKGTPIARLNFEIDTSYKQLTALRKSKVKDTAAIKLLEDEIRALRVNREKLVNTGLESSPDFKDNLEMIETAKELYLYIHSLLTSYFCQMIDLQGVQGQTVTYQDFSNIMPLLTTEEEKRSSVEEVFQIPFSFAKQELIDFLDNKLDKKNTFLEGDCMRISNGYHVIYVSNKHGQLVLYDPLPILITPSSNKELVAAIERSLFSSSDYLPISLRILRKASPEKTVRPDHLELIKTILNARSIKNIDAGKEGVTSVWMAAYAGDAAAIHLLAEHKADLAKPDDRMGRTPAIIAAFYGHAAVVAALKKCGANLDQVLEDGTTAAILAARYGHASVITELAKAEVDLNKADHFGSTPLLIAAFNGHADVVAELAKAGVDLNMLSRREGGTSLHWAIIKKNFACIKVLLDYDVDLNIQDKAGKSPLDYANEEVKAFIALQLLKKYIETHDWGGSCPSIASEHLKSIKEAETNGNWSFAFKNVTATRGQSQLYMLFTTQDDTEQNYLRLFSNQAYLIKNVKKLLTEESNSSLLERKKTC